ncbi:unnamed protein product [Rhizophagus irregularis]|nr:unnamed protein product [Rhizophagus irregularis]CAB5379389.1 unnamed protein product [Rhizophagus irregularis]
MVSISSISATSSSTTTSSRTTMPSQLQQHHDNGVRNDINVVSNQSNNSIMGNTNVKNTHNNRQFLFNNHDPQNQQHHTDSSRINREDEDMLIMDNNDNNKRNDDNVNYKSNTTIDNNSNKNNNNIINNNNNHLLNPSSIKNLSSYSRRKSSVLEISSLLCVPYDSPSSEDSMDDESSHLGDTESLGSPNKNLLTPNSSPPFSPPEMTATVDREKRLITNDNNINDNNFHSQHDLQTTQFKNNNNNNNTNNNSSSDYHLRQQQYHYNHESERYIEQERLEDTPWKRPRIINQDDNSKPLVLPSIRSFTSVPDLRIDSENLNGQFINSHHQPSSSLPSTPLSDHGKINSPADHHSPQKTWNNLEQFAAITEACRTSSNTNSSHSSHADIMDNSNIRLPPASSLTNNNHSFDNNNNSSVQQQSSQQSLLLRRSSFEIPQTTRYSPYTPSTLNPYMSSRLLSDQRRHSDLSGYTTSISTSPRNDHSENSYLHHNNHHHHHNNNPSSSPYGYDNRDRHYVQRSHYGGMHSPPSPNTYAVPHHSGYSMSSHNSHHHLQMSHHHHHHHLGSPYMDPTNSATMVKAKRKRANASQLKVLNQVFQHTFFPSTELRIQLGKQLGMSPRTVQIWFQNKRQSWRSKSRATTNSSMKDEDGQIDDGNLDVEGNVNDNNNVVSRRPSNSSLSCSDDDEMGRRTVPDSPTSPTESGYARSDYFIRNNNSNENNVNNMPSNGNVSTSTQNTYFGQSQHSSNNNSNGDYYHNHHRSNSVSTGGSGGNMTGSLQHHNNSSVITTSSSLPPPSSLTNQLPSPAYSTTSSVGNNERLPSISSFSHSNNYDPFTSSRLPAPIMINHRSQAQSSFNC